MTTIHMELFDQIPDRGAPPEHYCEQPRWLPLMRAGLFHVPSHTELKHTGRYISFSEKNWKLCLQFVGTLHHTFRCWLKLYTIATRGILVRRPLDLISGGAVMAAVFAIFTSLTKCIDWLTKLWLFISPFIVSVQHSINSPRIRKNWGHLTEI